MYPVAGGSARFPHYAFGSLAGFAGGWFAFLGAVTTRRSRSRPRCQYSTHYVSGLTTIDGGTPVLTAQGYAVAAVLMLLFSVINVMGVRWLAETNKADRLVEDRDPGPHGHRPDRDRVPPAQLHGGRRLHAVRAARASSPRSRRAA